MENYNHNLIKNQTMFNKDYGISHFNLMNIINYLKSNMCHLVNFIFKFIASNSLVNLSCFATKKYFKKFICHPKINLMHNVN